MHGEKIHAYGMHKLEQFCAHCGLAVHTNKTTHQDTVHVRWRIVLVGSCPDTKISTVDSNDICVISIHLGAIALEMFQLLI